MSPQQRTRGKFPLGAHSYQPTEDEVESLIARAREHPHGLEFLERGALDSVSATFRTHAFVVDAARERLARTEPPTDT